MSLAPPAGMISACRLLLIRLTPVLAAALFIATLLPFPASLHILSVTLHITAGLLAFTLLLSCPKTRFYACRAGRLLRLHTLIPGRLFLTLCFFWTLGLCAWLSGLLFHHVPHVNDSISQYVHAKFVAGGHIYGISHPLKEFFDSGWMTNDGKWYSQYSPGHVLLLALGQLAGAPWLINPAEGALTVLAIHALALELYGRATARLAALLACLCPLLLFMSSEFMNHATSLLFSTLFLLYFFKLLRRAAPHDAALAAAALGMVFITRPLSALALALPYALAALIRLCREPKRYAAACAAAIAVFLAFLAFHAWWNFETTGDMLVFPYNKQTDADIHWVWNAHGADGFRPFDQGLRIASARLILINRMLFEWPLPSLTFIALLFGGRCGRGREWLLLSGFVSLLAAHLFYNGNTEIFGPRYLYESISALIILTAVGLRRLPALLRLRLRLPARPAPVYALTALMLCLLSLLAVQGGVAARLRQYGSNYWEGNYGYYATILQQTQKPALVFISGFKPYLRVAFANPPTADAPVIFARDLGFDNSRLMEYYPCRNAYQMQGETAMPIRPAPPNCAHMP